jgi:hypothetical protein
MEKLSKLLQTRWPIVVLLASWMIMCLIMWPAGEFTLNDDWGFSAPVKWLAEDGVLQFNHWQAMTLIAQVFLGALWSAVFGFSQENLRLLVLVLGGLSLVSAYLFGRENGLSKKTAFAAAGLFLAWPIFSAMSASFMTDIPYLLFCLMAALFLLRSLREGEGWPVAFALGAFCLVAAVLVRQTGVAIAMAFIAAEFITHGFKRSSLLRSALLVAFCAGALFLYVQIVDSVSNNTEVLSSRNIGMREFIVDALHFRMSAINYFVATALWGLIYAGFFVAPIALAAAVYALPAARKNLRIAGALFVFAAASFALIYLTGRDFPRGNILSLEGIGPLLIEPYDRSDGGRSFSFPLAMAAAIGMAALAAAFIAGAVSAWTRLRARFDRGWLGQAACLLLLAGLTYLPYCVYYGAWFDRYLLSTAFFALIAAVFLAPKADEAIARAFPVVCALIGAGALWSSLLVRDYFEWSRARYALIDAARTEFGAAPDDINGGFEYINYEALMSGFPDNIPTELINPSDRAFVVAHAPRDGYEVLRMTTPPRLVSNRGGDIYLLRKSEGEPDGS